MAVYLIAYDLRQSDRDYAGFYDALDSYESERLLDNAHLIETQADAETVHRHLASAIEAEDRLWVSRLNEDYSGYIMAPAVEWLDARKPL